MAPSRSSPASAWRQSLRAAVALAVALVLLLSTTAPVSCGPSPATATPTTTTATTTTITAAPADVTAASIVVTVNPKKMSALVGDRFLSLTLDPKQLLEKRTHGLGAVRLMAAARGLAPAYLRLSGPSSETLRFVRELSAEPSSNVDRNGTITEADIQRLASWARGAGVDLVLGLNALVRARSDSDAAAAAADAWDSRNLLDLLAYTDRMGYSLAWQLGYETGELERAGVSGAQLGGDLARARALLGEFPRYQDALLLGPDVAAPLSGRSSKEAAHYLHDVARLAAPAPDVLVWQPWPSSVSEGRDPVNDPDLVRDDVSRFLGRVAARRPLWIAESGGESTSRFEDAITWAQRIQVAARVGADVILRRPDLQSDEHQPSPDFWVSLLHKRLCGRAVLDSRVAGNRSAVSVVSQCTPAPASRRAAPRLLGGFAPLSYERGDVTVLAVNRGSLPAKVSVKLSPSNGYSHHTTVHQYILTAPAEDLSSMSTLLNGSPLKLDNGGGLPVLTPKVRKTGRAMSLFLPPHSVAFFVLPGAHSRACQAAPPSAEEAAEAQLLLHPTNGEEIQVRFDIDGLPSSASASAKEQASPDTDPSDTDQENFKSKTKEKLAKEKQKYKSDAPESGYFENQLLGKMKHEIGNYGPDDDTMQVLRRKRAVPQKPELQEKDLAWTRESATAPEGEFTAPEGPPGYIQATEQFAARHARPVKLEGRLQQRKSVNMVGHRPRHLPPLPHAHPRGNPHPRQQPVLVKRGPIRPKMEPEESLVGHFPQGDVEFDLEDTSDTKEPAQLKGASPGSAQEKEQYYFTPAEYYDTLRQVSEEKAAAQRQESGFPLRPALQDQQLIAIPGSTASPEARAHQNIGRLHAAVPQSKREGESYAGPDEEVDPQVLMDLGKKYLEEHRMSAHQGHPRRRLLHRFAGAQQNQGKRRGESAVDSKEDCEKKAERRTSMSDEMLDFPVAHSISRKRRDTRLSRTHRGGRDVVSAEDTDPSARTRGEAVLHLDLAKGADLAPAGPGLDQRRREMKEKREERQKERQERVQKRKDTQVMLIPRGKRPSLGEPGELPLPLPPTAKRSGGHPSPLVPLSQRATRTRRSITEHESVLAQKMKLAKAPKLRRRAERDHLNSDATLQGRKLRNKHQQSEAYKPHDNLATIWADSPLSPFKDEKNKQHSAHFSKHRAQPETDLKYYITEAAHEIQPHHVHHHNHAAKHNQKQQDTEKVQVLEQKQPGDFKHYFTEAAHEFQPHHVQLHVHAVKHNQSKENAENVQVLEKQQPGDFKQYFVEAVHEFQPHQGHHHIHVDEHNHQPQTKKTEVIEQQHQQQPDDFKYFFTEAAHELLPHHAHHHVVVHSDKSNQQQEPSAKVQVSEQQQQPTDFKYYFTQATQELQPHHGHHHDHTSGHSKHQQQLDKIQAPEQHTDDFSHYFTDTVHNLQAHHVRRYGHANKRNRPSEKVPLVEEKRPHDFKYYFTEAVHEFQPEHQQPHSQEPGGTHSQNNANKVSAYSKWEYSANAEPSETPASETGHQMQSSYSDETDQETMQESTQDQPETYVTEAQEENGAETSDTPTAPWALGHTQVQPQYAPVKQNYAAMQTLYAPEYGQDQPQYAPAKQEYAPAQEEYAPAKPEYTSVQQVNVPEQPQYAFAKPGYVTVQQDYVPEQPQYTSAQQEYVGEQPQYAPAKLEYDAVQQEYVPEQPQSALTQQEYVKEYVPEEPQYAPAKPEYASVQQPYVQEQPQYAPAIPDYTRLQQEYVPEQPLYAPAKPECASVQQEYVQDQPQHAPVKPEYAIVQQEYVPEQAQYAPVKPEYATVQQVYVPESPEYAPAKPEYASVQQEYVQDQPQYAPVKPEYAIVQREYVPEQAQYAPVKPEYATVQQVYVPEPAQYDSVQQEYNQEQPDYAPAKPEYALVQQGYVPEQPQFAPAQQEYASVQEEYVPEQPEYGFAKPQYAQVEQQYGSSNALYVQEKVQPENAPQQAEYAPAQSQYVQELSVSAPEQLQTALDKTEAEKGSDEMQYSQAETQYAPTVSQYAQVQPQDQAEPQYAVDESQYQVGSQYATAEPQFSQDEHQYVRDESGDALLAPASPQYEEVESEDGGDETQDLQLDPHFVLVNQRHSLTEQMNSPASSEDLSSSHQFTTVRHDEAPTDVEYSQVKSLDGPTAPEFTSVEHEDHAEENTSGVQDFDVHAGQVRHRRQTEQRNEEAQFTEQVVDEAPVQQAATFALSNKQQESPEAAPEYAAPENYQNGEPHEVQQGAAVSEVQQVPVQQEYTPGEYTQEAAAEEGAPAQQQEYTAGGYAQEAAAEEGAPVQQPEYTAGGYVQEAAAEEGAPAQQQEYAAGGYAQEAGVEEEAPAQQQEYTAGGYAQEAAAEEEAPAQQYIPAAPQHVEVAEDVPQEYVAAVHAPTADAAPEHGQVAHRGKRSLLDRLQDAHKDKVMLETNKLVQDLPNPSEEPSEDDDKELGKVGEDKPDLPPGEQSPVQRDGAQASKSLVEEVGTAKAIDNIEDLLGSLMNMTHLLKQAENATIEHGDKNSTTSSGGGWSIFDLLPWNLYKSKNVTKRADEFVADAAADDAEADAAETDDDSPQDTTTTKKRVAREITVKKVLQGSDDIDDDDWSAETERMRQKKLARQRLKQQQAARSKQGQGNSSAIGSVEPSFVQAFVTSMLSKVASIIGYLSNLAKDSQS